MVDLISLELLHSQMVAFENHEVIWFASHKAMHLNKTTISLSTYMKSGCVVCQELDC